MRCAVVAGVVLILLAACKKDGPPNYAVDLYACCDTCQVNWSVSDGQNGASVVRYLAHYKITVEGSHEIRISTCRLNITDSLEQDTVPSAWVLIDGKPSGFVISGVDSCVSLIAHTGE